MLEARGVLRRHPTVSRPARLRALCLIAVAVACTGGGAPIPTPTATPPRPVPPTASPTGSLALVGYSPLYERGMNAGLAVWGDHAYVGSRTDGSEGHLHPGVLVISIRDPSHPEIVGEIGPPDEGNPGETSRELRIWPHQGLLLVLNFTCDPDIHDCVREIVRPTIRFYDIGGDLADRPRLVSTYEPSETPHEFFLWQDPEDAGRALLFMSTPGGRDALLVTDISRAREGKFEEVARWSAAFPDPGPINDLHSLSVSPDGGLAYLAHLTRGFFMIDTSDVAQGRADAEIGPVTPIDKRVYWEGWGAHSAVPIPGRSLVLTTDEVYGRDEPGGGCPWGWVRIIDVTDPESPSILSEYRVLPYNPPTRCGTISEERDRHSSFSSHNPTLTEHLAFVTWHSAGLQVFTTADPARPAQVAEFVPDPLSGVATEDPALSSGSDKVVMWSYPLIQDGLIYVVDVRNGLYVLAYQGPYEGEVRSARFLEGNSNLGEVDS